MHRVVRFLTFVSLAFLLTIITSTSRVATRQGPVYQVVDVGSLGGATSDAVAVEDWGSAFAGSARTTANVATHAYYSSYFRMQDLGTLGGRDSVATATSGGYVVGHAQLASGLYHAFLWPGTGGMVDLGTLGGTVSWGYGVNDDGVVVGAAMPASGGRRAFIYRDGQMTQLALGTAYESEARDINNSGQVTGWYRAFHGEPMRAFRWENGVRTDLGTLATGASINAVAINESGIVVGQAATASSGLNTRAFRWENGTLTALPTLGGNSSATAINSDAVVVGWSTTAQGSRAVMWRGQQIVDLNDLIEPDSGWVLETANGIDRFGGIVGVGRLNGVQRGFFLVPPLDLSIRLSGHQNDLDTNFPNPHEAGHRLDLGATLDHSSGLYLATGVEFTATIGGPFQFDTWPDNCRQSGQQLTCAVPPYEEGFGKSVFYAVRSTGPGTLTHTVQITASDTHDPNPANDIASQTNTAVSLASLTLASSSITGGKPVLGRATLTSVTPAGGARVTLSSSRPDIASVPSEFDVLPWSYGGLYREFYVTTQPVSAPVTVQISARYGLRTYTQSLTINPSGGSTTSTPYGGAARDVPGIIQAEDFDEGGPNVAYVDTTTVNSGGLYRNTSVDIERTTDSSGGVYNIGWMAPSEWLQYTVNVATAGAYRLELRVAANGVGGRVHVEFNGADKTGPLNIPNTGGWQAWTTIGTNVTLAAGPQRMRVVIDAAGPSGVVGNLNFIQLTAALAASTPFTGTAVTLPGIVQAENFDKGGENVAYHDTTTGNNGGAYRLQEHVDLQATTDAGGGYNVGWMAAGEWLNYSVTVPSAGTYRLDLRVAASGAGGRVHVEFNGVDKTGAITIPNTGGWQTWTTVSAPVTLSAGPQRMRVVVDAAGPTGVVGNLNRIEIVGAAALR